LFGKVIIILKLGRVHMYEGYGSREITFIPYFSAFYGCRDLIITNASGGGIEGMKLGSIMISKDHMCWANKCGIPSVHNDSRFGEKYFRSSEGHSKYLFELA